ncbi:hypothetical protein FHS76_001969 [Ochrobactrum daejeonense]|uniref:Oxidoreductase molybdopterin-binding domain-containing protein n=1 Tax=Brucella daejeonensis TaxID=659015 RepID=A0A7W9AXK4_9HYPH|nr:molybdopterin-dependent oxidoreductase [Brucella daejeonensis]MBB5702094.1 hypothetical protein [Brucella daejeonensis]
MSRAKWSRANWMIAFRRLLAPVTLIALLVLTQTLASTVPSHAEPATTLTVIGPNGNRRVLTRDDFARLPQSRLQTSTAWTEGPQSFDGVLLRDVLATVGIDGRHIGDRQITVSALNDYSVEIPLLDAFKYDVLLAHRMNGKVLNRRDKGPYWIVYPRDQHEELDDLRYAHRWAWQLKQIEVK